MKRLFLILVVLFAHVLTFAQGFTVKDFTVDFYLKAEGYFDVVENYELEFTEAKHGIYRDIFTNYKLQTPDGKVEKRNLVIQNIEVPGQNFKINNRLEQRSNNKISIRIGDANRTVIGLQHYEIKYRVYNAFLFNDSSVQFYWNVKPSDWLAVFQNIHCNIHVPESIPLSARNCFLYAGNEGISEPSTDFAYQYSDGLFRAQSHDFFFSTPNQSVTILIKLPADAIQKNFIVTPIWREYGWIGVLLFLVVVFWWVWRKYGKDDKVVATTSYYPPLNINPAMAGYLMDDKGDSSDLIALIPHWATQGLLLIEEIPKSGFFSSVDMKLTRRRQLPDGATKYERKVFEGLFGLFSTTVLISSLRNTFYTVMNAAKTELKRDAQQYYVAKSNQVMKITACISVGAGVLLAVLFLFVFGVIAAISASVVGVFLAFMSFFIQKKNNLGNEVLTELIGFKQFIKYAEIDRLKMLLKEDPNYFEKTMSYALAFGLLEQWGQKFNDLNLAAPSWYSGSNAHGMGIYLFSKSFNNTVSHAQSNMVSAPSSSSSGGGSSGGGFGGGGGGSW